MPRQCILTAAERAALLAFPIEKSELIRLYTFSEQDLSVIKQRRGDANHLTDPKWRLVTRLLGLGLVTMQFSFIYASTEPADVARYTTG
jgi:hypothetical protein